MFKQQIRSIYSFVNMFLLVFQSFMPGIFAFLPTQAYAQYKQDVKSVSLEFFDESNEFELSVVAESDVSYVLSYEDEQGVTKGITGVAQVKDGVARATEYAGTCSSDLKCVPDSFEKGVLELPKAEYKSDFVLADAGLWLVSGAVATISSVDLGVEYVAPQNDGVRVQFTKLPKTSGNLRIEEIKLSDEQVKELGAYSNVAYDISSDMPDGSFEYKLQLPLPEGADENSQLVYAESVAELNSAQKIESGEIVSETIVAEGLDHFTVFVVTDPNSFGNGNSCTVASISGTCYDTLQGAIDAASDGDTIELASDITVTQRVNINKAVILDGNGHMVFASYEKTSNSNNAALSISADNVVVTDLTVDGTGGYYVWNKQLHGINIYSASNIYLDNVNAENFGGSGIVVNSSGVTVNNVSTIGNVWHGINVDQKTSDPSVLTVLGTSTHTDVLHIYVDDSTKDVTINDVENQYQVNHPGVNGEPNDRLYTLNGTVIPGSHTYEYDFKTFDGGVAGLWATDYIHAELELIPDGAGCYTYTRTDTGTFETLEGRSPNNTADILAGIMGDLSGGISGRICGDIKSDIDLTYEEDLTVGSYPSYAEKYFHRILENISGFSFNNPNGWGWTFTTCNNGTWIDTDSEISGDITGAYVPCDSSGPEAPVISFPLDEQYFNSTPILNNWTDVTDSSGISKYRIKYIYDDGHTFSGAPYRETTVSQRNHTPGIGEQGGVTIWVQAFDGAGNEGAWSEPVHYFYDATAPLAPTLISPADGARVTGNPTQTWDSVADAHHYIYESYLDSSLSTPAYTTTVYGTSRTVGGNQTVTFWWRVKAVDAAGNESPWSDDWQLNVDNTNPTVPTIAGFLNPTVACGGLTNSHSTTVEWNDSTDTSGIAGYEYNIQYPLPGGGFGNWTTFLVNSQYGGSLNEGTHSVKVRAKDNAGLFSEWSNLCTITSDWTNPVTTLTSPTPGSTNLPITIAGSSTDLNTVATVSLFYSVAGQNDWQPLTTISNTGSLQPFPFSYAWTPDAQGTYDIKASGTDMAGNVENSAYVYGVTYDTTAPTAPGLDTPVDGFKTKGVAFTQKWFSVSDAVSYEYQSCNTDPGDVSDTCSSVKFTQTFNGVNNTTKSVGAGQPDSHFWWRVRAKDSAANWSNWSESRELTIDNSAPTTLWNSLASTYFSATPVLTGVATDAYLAGIANVTYRVENTSDSSTVFDWQNATPSDGTFNSVTENFVTNLSSLADGAYTFLAKSIDQVGNQGLATEVDLIVDTIAPDVAVTAPTSGLISGTVAIRGTVTDVNPHHYWFVVQNSGGTTVAGPGTVNNPSSFTDQLLLNWNTTTVADGVYTIKLEARDSAENKDAGSVSWITVTVDNTAPVTTLSTPVTDQKSNQAIEIAGNSTDTNGINFVNLYYSVADADSWTLIDTVDNTVDSTSFDFNYAWTPAEGKYDIKVEATDVLGNVEHTAYAYDVIYDVTDPTSEITTYDLDDGEEWKTSTFDGLLEGTATDLTTDIASGVDHVLLSISHLGFGEEESNTKYWDATGSAWVSEQSLFRTDWDDDAETWDYQLSDTPEGFYTVVSHAVDKAGNVEDTYTIKIVYDKTIPEVNLAIDPTSPNGNNGWYKTLPTITLIANDNYFVDHIEYQWNSTSDAGWTTYSAPITPPGEGRNILYYRAIDAVGNPSVSGIKEVKFDKTVPANGPLNVRVENIGSVEALGKWDKPNGDEQVHEYRVSWRHPVSGTEYSDFVSASTFEHKLVNLFDGVWEFKVQLLDAAGNNKEATAQFRVGSDPSAVLGATTDQTVGTGTGGTFFNTQQVSQEDELEDAESAKEKAEAEAAGTVLGESDDTCAPWQFYLPLFLLLIQALLAISLEFINKELSAKKLLFAILISGLMIGAFYMLRDPSCYSGGSAMQSLAKFFVPLSLLLAFVLRVIGSLTVEEK